jgi:hypothetical protein
VTAVGVLKFAAWSHGRVGPVSTAASGAPLLELLASALASIAASDIAPLELVVLLVEPLVLPIMPLVLPLVDPLELLLDPLLLELLVSPPPLLVVAVSLTQAAAARSVDIWTKVRGRRFICPSVPGSYPASTKVHRFLHRKCARVLG